MKITLFLTNDFPPIVSGISTIFYEFLKRTDREDYIIICPLVKGAREFDQNAHMNVRRVWIPTGESGLSKLLKTLLGIIYALFFSLRYKDSSIQCGQILSNGPGGLICKKVFGIPYSVWVYGSETIRFRRYKILERLMGWILKEAKRVVVDSSFTEKEYLDFGVLPDKIVELTPGVDTEIFAPKEKDEGLIEKYSLRNKTILMTVSRLDERKGHDMVLETIPGLINSYPDIVYLIVGKGREEERLREMVIKKGIKDFVIFAGYVSEDKLPSYYNLCDIFILPNRVTEKSALKGDYEGFGIVFLEAGACGKPVIGGKSGGVPDAVQNGITGILVDPHSAEEIFHAIISMLEDPKLRRKMGEAGRKRAEESFDWKVLNNLFKEIIS